MESVSLGWREPVRVEGVSLKGADSNLVLSIAELKTSAHLWSLLTGRSGLGIRSDYHFSFIFFMLNVVENFIFFLISSLISLWLCITTKMPMQWWCNLQSTGEKIPRQVIYISTLLLPPLRNSTSSTLT